ncbi:hypothetical protein DdX_17502 [Ditylenchus destructor]|uniref:Uncharacterized protein n=1 Tax=Ditylenchus destructor TaxID=166010 RepID=A0AAD4MR78_9BILA|nr:hypothetical protein DdX_17502 [Ditylenchus destructor]
MVTAKLFIILCVIAPVLAQNATEAPKETPVETTRKKGLDIFEKAEMKKCFEDRTEWTDDEETKLCVAYRGLRSCLEDAKVDEKKIVKIIEETRKEYPKLKDKCGCATIALNIAIGFASLAAVVLQKMGVLGHF